MEKKVSKCEEQVKKLKKKIQSCVIKSLDNHLIVKKSMTKFSRGEQLIKLSRIFAAADLASG